jgi:hypothetical protein
MMKKLLVAASLALLALGAPAAVTPAKADVRVYFGVPFHPYRVAPGWRYYDGYGWYDYGRYGDFRPYDKLTCRQAIRRLDRRGYDDIDVRDCAGRNYSFRATTPKGKRVTVYVNAYTGEMWR